MASPRIRLHGDSMEVIGSNLRTADRDFLDNQARMKALVGDLKERLGQVRASGGERAVELHPGRGKLLARERIEGLVDANTPFLELSPSLHGTCTTGKRRPAGIVTGIGMVHGKEVVVVANDATVRAALTTRLPSRNTPRPRNRLGEPPALHLPSGLRGSLPPVAGRGLS